MKRQLKAKKIIKSFFIVPLNVAFIALDVVFILAFIACLVATLVIFLYLLFKLLGIQWEFFYKICIELKNRFPIEIGEDDLIPILTVCLSGVLIPGITALITSYYSNKSLSADLAKSLAEVKDIQLYLVKLHESEWNELSNAFYKDEYVLNVQKAAKPNLGEFNYCLNLCFKGQCFQNYNLHLREVGFEDINLEQKRNAIRNEYNFRHIPYVISDNTGVIGKTNDRATIGNVIVEADTPEAAKAETDAAETANAEVAKGKTVKVEIVKDNDKTDSDGTNINILFKDKSLNNFESLKAPYYAGANIYFEVRFTPSQDFYWIRVKQIHKCFVFFPLIRGIFQFLVWAKMRYNFQRIRLWLNDSQYLDKEHNIRKYSIYDVDIESVRNDAWTDSYVSEENEHKKKKEPKSKAKKVKGRSKTEITKAEEQPKTEITKAEEQPKTEITKVEEQPKTEVAKGIKNPQINKGKKSKKKKKTKKKSQHGKRKK